MNITYNCYIGAIARVMDELENPGGGAQQYLGPNLSICQK